MPENNKCNVSNTKAFNGNVSGAEVNKSNDGNTEIGKSNTGRTEAKKSNINKTEAKRQREKDMVSQMIALYCRKKHNTRGELCDKCRELSDYAVLRSDKCPFMETKTFCSNCKVHCYKPKMRERIREVMRFSGPRMIFHHPVAAMRHVIETKKEKKRLEEANDN